MVSHYKETYFSRITPSSHFMININMRSVCGTASGHSLNYILIFLPRSLVYRMLILFLCVKLSYPCHCYTDSQKESKLIFRLCNKFTGLLEYYALFFLKYSKTVVGWPGPRGPPSCSTTDPPQQEQGEKIRWNSSWAEIRTGTVFVNYCKKQNRL